MTHLSVTTQFLRKLHRVGLHSGDLETTCSQQECLAGHTSHARSLGLREHPRFIPLQSCGQPYLFHKPGRTHAQCTEGRFWKFDFEMQDERLPAAQVLPGTDCYLPVRFTASAIQVLSVFQGVSFFIWVMVMGRRALQFTPLAIAACPLRPTSLFFLPTSLPLRKAGLHLHQPI